MNLHSHDGQAPPLSEIGSEPKNATKSERASVNVASRILGEFGAVLPEGAECGLKTISARLTNVQLYSNICMLLEIVLEKIDDLAQKIIMPDRSLVALSKSDIVLEKLESMPGA